MGMELMETLKQVFPERNNQPAAKAWKFGKFHAIVHVVFYVVLFGWSENTSGQWGERGHTEHFKPLGRLTNNKDTDAQLLRWHQRRAHLQLEEFLEAERLNVGDDSADEETIPQCELALRFPLFHAAKHFQTMQYTVAGAGSNGRGKHAVNVWDLPASRNPKSWFVREHPIMTKLPTALGVFAYEFFKKSLRL